MATETTAALARRYEGFCVGCGRRRDVCWCETPVSGADYCRGSDSPGALAADEWYLVVGRAPFAHARSPWAHELRVLRRVRDNRLIVLEVEGYSEGYTITARQDVEIRTLRLATKADDAAARERLEQSLAAARRQAQES